MTKGEKGEKVGKAYFDYKNVHCSAPDIIFVYPAISDESGAFSKV